MKALALLALIAASAAHAEHCVLTEKVLSGGAEQVVTKVDFVQVAPNILTAQSPKFKVTLEERDQHLITTAIMPNGNTGSSDTFTYPREARLIDADGTRFQSGPNIADVSCR
jgi:hypothetical protein